MDITWEQMMLYLEVEPSRKNSPTVKTRSKIARVLNLENSPVSLRNIHEVSHSRLSCPVVYCEEPNVAVSEYDHEKEPYGIHMRVSVDVHWKAEVHQDPQNRDTSSACQCLDAYESPSDGVVR